MALPRIVAVTCKRKQPMNDGNVNIAFEVKGTEDVGVRGYLRIVAASAVADDFDVDTEYTATLTVGD